MLTCESIGKNYKSETQQLLLTGIYTHRPRSRRPGSARNDLEDLGKMAGYEVFFDPQVTSRRIHVDLILVRWRDAMDFSSRVNLELPGASWHLISIIVEPQKVPKHRTTRGATISTSYWGMNSCR